MAGSGKRSLIAAGGATCKLLSADGDSVFACAFGTKPFNNKVKNNITVHNFFIQLTPLCFTSILIIHV